MTWLQRNAPTLEAIAACVTALVAVAALIGVKYQLDETDRLQQTSAAREAYRGHLALAASTPAFADPADSCALLQSDDAGAYAAFVDHLMYSAELMLAVDTGWDAVFVENMRPHAGYICSAWLPFDSPLEINQMLINFTRDHCKPATTCS